MENFMHGSANTQSDEGGIRPQFYLYYHNEKNSPWEMVREEKVLGVLTEIRPRYKTVLATTLGVLPGAKVTHEDKQAARYKGPFYVDFDAKEGDLPHAITKINEFLDKLERLGLDLYSIRIYCTGGRGFHVEIPAETFMQTVPMEGVLGLPLIYKGMLWQLFVDTMDSNVYSSGRGRMWRIANVQRENGKYKVPVTLESVREMTPERYEALVSTPRQQPIWTAPAFCPALAEIYRVAIDKAFAGRKKQRRSSQRSSRSTAGTAENDAPSAAAEFIRFVADAALDQIDTLLPRWLPDGFWEGDNYVALNPRRDDKNLGSFKINSDGYWKDFACDPHKGGDLVALKRFLEGDTYTMLDAARHLAAEIGFDLPDTDTSADSQPSTAVSVSGGSAVSGSGGSVPESGGRPPVIFSAVYLLAQEIAPARWIIIGILPEGLSLLAGSPKIGKSWLVLEIAIAVASGGTCLGGKEVMPGRVLYLALEDNRRRLKDRITALLEGGARPLPEKLDLALEWPRLDQGGLPKLDEWLTQHPDTRLVVIDTLAKMRRKQTSNSNLYADDYAVGAELKTLSDRHRVAIVLVTHVRKAESQDPLEMVTGTLGLVGGMDGILVMKRERGQGTASLFVTGRDVPDEQTYGLTWNKEACRWTIAGDAKDLQMSEARKEITSVLMRERRPLSAKEISQLSGRKYDATRRLLPDMVKGGIVDEIRDGQRWLYVHPLHAGSSAVPSSPSSHTPNSDPIARTPPSLPSSGGGLLARARDAGRAAQALNANGAVAGGAGPLVILGTSVASGNGGASGSDGRPGNSSRRVPEFPESPEPPNSRQGDVPGAPPSA